MISIILACLGISVYLYPLFHLGNGEALITFLTGHTISAVSDSGYGLGLVLTIIAFWKGLDDYLIDWSDFESAALNLSLSAGGVLSIVLGLFRLVPWLFSLPLLKSIRYIAWFIVPVGIIAFFLIRKDYAVFPTLLQVRRRRRLDRVPSGSTNPKNRKQSGKSSAKEKKTDGRKHTLFYDPVYRTNGWLWCILILSCAYLVFHFYSHLNEGHNFMVWATEAVTRVKPFSLENIPSWSVLCKCLLGLFVLSSIMCIYVVVDSKDCNIKTVLLYAAVWLLATLFTRVLLYARYLIPFVSTFIEIVMGVALLLILWIPIGVPVVCAVSWVSEKLGIPIPGFSSLINGISVSIPSEKFGNGYESGDVSDLPQFITDSNGHRWSRIGSGRDWARYEHDEMLEGGTGETIIIRSSSITGSSAMTDKGYFHW